MKSKRLLIGALCIVFLGTGALTILRKEPKGALIRVEYQSCTRNPWLQSQTGRTPKEVSFEVINKSSGSVLVWDSVGIEFKSGGSRAVPKLNTYTILDGPGVATRQTCSLTGNERGEWRVLVAVSDYRRMDFAARWLPFGVTRLLRPWLQGPPVWVASEWLMEEPERTPADMGFAKQAGDLQQFLDGSLTSCSSPHTRAVDRPQVAECEWWARSDTNGVVIVMDRSLRDLARRTIWSLCGPPIARKSRRGSTVLLWQSDERITVAAFIQLSPMTITVLAPGAKHGFGDFTEAAEPDD